MESVLETPYDNGTRRLMGICAQDLVEWLLPGAFCTGKLSEKFESFDIEADAMQETLFYDKLALVHVEFQSGPDTGMAQRLLEYLVMAYRRYKCPVISYVVYLKKCALPKPPLVLTLPNGEECLRLNYKVIALPQTLYEELLAKGIKGLLPLVPLAHNGARRDVIEELILRLLPAHDTVEKELLALLQLFASLAFGKENKESQEWLKRRFRVLNDIFRETPAYQWILEEGREEGFLKGKEEGHLVGKKEGRLEGRLEGQMEERQTLLLSMREVLVKMVQGRFPPLSALATAQADRVEDVEQIQDLLVKISTALTLEQVQQHLLSVQQQKRQ